MAYSIEEEDKILAMFEAIGNQPIEHQRPYNEVRNPKPMMESAVFDGTKVDLGAWTGSQKPLTEAKATGVVADSTKVGKAKTASNPDLTKGTKAAKGTTVATKGTKDQVTENDTVTEKKEDKQVTKLVTEDASHEAKGEPKAKSGNFDSTAKSTASSQRSKAESNKKFSEESKTQRKINMFRDFVKSLGVDAETKEAAEKVLKKFDQISKHIGNPKMESIEKKIINESVRESTLPASERVNTFLEIVDTLGPGDSIDRKVCETIANSIRRMIATDTPVAYIGSPSWSVSEHDVERIKMMLEQSGIGVEIEHRPSFTNGRPFKITLTGEMGTVSGFNDTPDDIIESLYMELKNKCEGGGLGIFDNISKAIDEDKLYAEVYRGGSKITSRLAHDEYKEGDPNPGTLSVIENGKAILEKYGFGVKVADDGVQTVMTVKIPENLLKSAR